MIKQIIHQFMIDSDDQSRYFFCFSKINDFLEHVGVNGFDGAIRGRRLVVGTGVLLGTLRQRFVVLKSKLLVL